MSGVYNNKNVLPKHFHSVLPSTLIFFMCQNEKKFFFKTLLRSYMCFRSSFWFIFGTVLFEVTALASSQVTINDVIQMNKKFFYDFFLLSFPTVQVSSEFAYKQCMLPFPLLHSSYGLLPFSRCLLSFFPLHLIFFIFSRCLPSSLFKLPSFHSHVAFLPLSPCCLLPTLFKLPFFDSHVTFLPSSLFILPSFNSLHVTVYYKYSHITFICSLWQSVIDDMLTRPDPCEFC